MDDHITSKNEVAHPTKLPFTSVAAPDPAARNDALGPSDLDHYDSSNAKVNVPATKKEVASYYSYYAGNNGIGSVQ